MIYIWYRHEIDDELAKQISKSIIRKRWDKFEEYRKMFPNIETVNEKGEKVTKIYFPNEIVEGPMSLELCEDNFFMIDKVNCYKEEEN